MSRIDSEIGKNAPLLQCNKMFGEIPSIGGSNDKPVRLADQIDQIKETAYKNGFDSGFKNGTLAGQAEGRKAGFQRAMSEVKLDRIEEISKLMEDLETFRLEFEEAANDWAVRTEIAVADLSMEVVKRILATELEINHQVALEICKEVLQKVTHAKQARIRINPKDYALFESHRDEIMKQSRELEMIEIVEDNSVRGGVIVETKSGTIDATIETRLELIVNEFHQAA